MPDLTSLSSTRTEGTADRSSMPGAAAFLARGLGVFLLFAAATAILFWQWMPHLHSALIGPPEDNLNDFWNTWYVAFAQNANHFFYTDLLRFPEGTPLTYQSFAYPQVFAIALISKIFGLGPASLILQQNLGLLISFPLAGTGAFYLVRHFAAHTGGALVGGFVFAFNPSHVEHVMHHAGVSQIEFIPFFVLAFLLTIERKSILLLAATVVLFALNALSCWYYIFYASYFVVFHTLYVAIRDRALPRGWQLITPIASVTGVVVLLSPLLVPMVRAGLGSMSAYLSGSDWYVADLLAYPAFPPFHALGPWAEGIYSRLNGNEWEATAYLGLVNMVVLAWLYFSGRVQDRRLLTYVLCGMAVFCVVASGDSLHVLGHPLRVPGHRTIPMPGVVLSHLPFFKNVRTPSRAIVFVYLFMAIGIGYAVTLAWRSPTQHIGRLAVAIVAALIVLDFFPARRLPMTPLLCSPGLAVIRDDPEQGFGVLDLPQGLPDLPQGYLAGNLYMSQQTCHGRPIAQGTTSRNLVVSLRDRLETTDFPAQRRQLVDARVKYIVINHEPMGVPLQWLETDGNKDQYSTFYPVAYDGPDLTVLRVY
ncbi:MAG TPA: hypothetical protein VK714_05220 [Myxococcota bacterium]|nr:hypothetical protein [Myxococcota bacterium]